MIDLSKIEYHVVVIDESGNQYNITDYIENLGWEENENELSVHSSFTARNDKTSKGYLSNLIKPGCMVVIFASEGSGAKKEVARGYVVTWNPVQQNSLNDLKFTCYDELYHLQKSQDNRYFSSGTGTQSAISSILNDWGVPMGDYRGPNVSHGKLVYNNKYLSDIVLELLDDAVKKGGEKCVIREIEGRTEIVPKGSNNTVYVFRADNTKVFNESVSTTELVTRVKVVGKADDDENHSVEAILNGLTEYGIHQRIYIRGSDESLNDAQEAAQEILNKNGSIKKKITLQSPDVPYIRKGDLVYVISSGTSDYYYVKSVQHDADTYSMTMNLEEAEEKTIGNNNVSSEKNYEVGDIVNFHGGTHYVSSYSDSKGYNARAGKAKITIKNGSGKTHPWHLIHIDSESDVYGWVDNGTFD
jgi:hypothetical protein